MYMSLICYTVTHRRHSKTMNGGRTIIQGFFKETLDDYVKYFGTDLAL
jgi:hypothetical protein